MTFDEETHACHLFFALLFDHMLLKIRELSALPDNAFPHGKESEPSSFATAWREILAESDTRFTFFKDILDQFQRVRYHSHCFPFPRCLTLRQELLTATDQNISQRAKVALKALLRELPEKKLDGTAEGLQLLIYVDEAHTITDNTGESVYDALLKALTEYKGQLVFVVFLSTAAPVGELAAPSYLASSARKRAVTKSLLAPYTEMAFDCHPSLIARIDDANSLSDVQSLAFVVRFGRSL